MPFLILLFLFVFVPVIEISLLIRVGGSIGGFNTILIVILTAVLGAYLVRQQGFETLRNVQQKTNQGAIPAMEMAEGVALLFAGAVLLTPGFITDAIGFALLTPMIRRNLIAWFAKQGIMRANNMQGGFGAQFDYRNQPGDQQSNTIIEGEVVEPKGRSD